MGKLGVVSSLVLPWFGRCVSVAVRLLIRSAAPLLLGVCFVRFVCGSCAVRAGSVRVRMMVPGGHVPTRNKIFIFPCSGWGSRFMRAARVARRAGWFGVDDRRGIVEGRGLVS